MKTANATKKLERNGFKVTPHKARGFYETTGFQANKGTQRITWNDRDGEVSLIYLEDTRFEDHGVVYPANMSRAIEGADLAIKREREEAPMIAEKQRQAEKRTARSLGQMFKL